MTDHTIAIDAGMSKLDLTDWVRRLKAIASENGYYEQLGAKHSASFIDAGPKLLVTFENIETVRTTNPGQEPRGYSYVRRNGWSHLAIFSTRESWFRDPAVYAFFDRLTDEDFFDNYDEVMFYGAHSCAYAACAFSVASPGATVMALRPQATLRPRIAGFDSRHTEQRRTDFTSRYGYAPDMVDAAQKVFVAFDPQQRFDAIHAALFTRDNVQKLRCPGLGWKIDSAFDAMDIHDDLIRAAMHGTLTNSFFSDAMLARRDYSPYLRSLLNRAIHMDHPVLAANLCSLLLSESEDPFFRSKLDELKARGFSPSTIRQVNAAE